ncbi:MAG: riboflavin synthase [Eubacterium sp.]
MFTGIIEETGNIAEMPPSGKSGVLTIACRKVLEGTEIGDSIAVNGICLTVTKMTASTFSADVMPETIRRSSLSRLTSGNRVNLERAMAADGRFGGHIVSGHIDGTGTIISVKKEGNAVWYRVQFPEEMLPCMVEKGSIAIDGISLTIAELAPGNAPEFSVSIIPTTMGETILGEKRAGDLVNLETDIIGKYVARNLDIYQSRTGIRTLSTQTNASSGNAQSGPGSASDQEWESLIRSL